MIELHNALKIMFENVKPLEHETINIKNAGFRVLAEDVASDIDMPLFDKAAMDGYACKRKDLARPLEIVETIAAGATPKRLIGSGQCAKIMTGAKMPKGADCVIIIEETKIQNDGRVIFTEKETTDNFCSQGEDIKVGDIVLKKGTLIRPQHIAVLASVGRVKLKVFKKPRVALLATGDELISPSQKPIDSKIRDSNSSQICAQITAMGCRISLCKRVKDKPEALTKAFKEAISKSDFILLSGGVSMGEFDFVPEVIKKVGFKILFDSVAIKPGKPTKFAVSEKICCMGLPGNPVSTFVQFEILAKPFLYRMMGHDFKYNYSTKVLSKKIVRDKTDRLEWLPVMFEGADKVAPIEHHGSAHVNSVANADGLISIGIGISELKEGNLVNVRQI